MANTDRSPLIICVGNPSRGDDAIGPLIAEALQLQQPNLNVIETFQLQPELVEDMADHALVIILDAQTNTGESITLRRILPTSTLGWCSHALSPEQLAGLYQTAFAGPLPEIIAIGIQARQFELGTPPSHSALACVAPVVAALRQLVTCASLPAKEAFSRLQALLQPSAFLHPTTLTPSSPGGA